MAKIATTVTHTLTLTTDELKALRQAAKVALGTEEGDETERAVWTGLRSLLTAEEFAPEALFYPGGRS